MFFKHTHTYTHTLVYGSILLFRNENQQVGGFGFNFAVDCFGVRQPEMHVSLKFLQIQREQCRLLRCTECCFCGGQFSEAPVQQEPEPDSNGSEAEQQMDKNAGWDEGTCAQCGACYVRSIIRPVLCQCGAELCGYSFRCFFAHAKRCAAATNAQAAYE